MEDRRLIFYSAGLSLVLSTALLGIATIVGAKTHIETQKFLAEKPNSSLAERFASGASLSADDVQQLAALVIDQPQISQLSSRLNGDTLLHLAARFGIADVAETLLRTGSSKAARNGNGLAAYQLAKDATLAELLRPEA